MKRTILLGGLLWLLGASALAQGMYYVNPQGGRYVHADRQCDSMDEKYWAELEEITQEQAQERGLRACGLCMEEAHKQAAVSDGNPMVYTLGGSEADVAHDVAAMPDGGVLLAGFTQSNDGTLFDRTKTGWTGWLSCVDAQGNTLWNFCSRQGSNDHMRAPAAHADGTITVLLSAGGHEKNLVELIRLNAQGEVISRKTILELSNQQGQCLIEKPGIFSGGYVLAGASDDEPFLRITYRWFDFEGNLLKTVEKQWDSAVMAVSKSHIIEAHDGAYWLCSIDARGNDTRLCRLFESDGRDQLERMTFTSLASLDDGGALACAHQRRTEGPLNRLIRFAADGSVVWQLDLDGFVPDDVCAVQDGFALTGEIRPGECMLYWGDAQGNLLGSSTLSRVYEYNEARTLAILADGRAAHAGVTQGGRGSSGWANYDVQLCIAAKQ